MATHWTVEPDGDNYHYLVYDRDILVGEFGVCGGHCDGDRCTCHGSWVYWGEYLTPSQREEMPCPHTTPST